MDVAERVAAFRQQLRGGVKVVTAPQLFPTPGHVAARMVELAGLEMGARVLEPSAGTGRILQALPEGAQVEAVELKPVLVNVLRERHAGVTVHCANFLVWAPQDKFDAIIMNPPFAKGADIRHVLHALPMLAVGGTLVALCADGPRQERALRPLVEPRGGHWESLGDAFRAEGTGVRVRMLSIQR